MNVLVVPQKNLLNALKVTLLPLTTLSLAAAREKEILQHVPWQYLDPCQKRILLSAAKILIMLPAQIHHASLTERLLKLKVKVLCMSVNMQWQWRKCLMLKVLGESGVHSNTVLIVQAAIMFKDTDTACHSILSLGKIKYYLILLFLINLGP